MDSPAGDTSTRVYLVLHVLLLSMLEVMSDMVVRG